MIRLLVRLASSSFCLRRACTQKSSSSSSSIASAAEASFSSLKPASPDTLSWRTIVFETSHSSLLPSTFCISRHFSPSCRLFGRRSLKLGFSAQNSLYRYGFADQHVPNVPILEKISAIEHQSLLRLNSASHARSFHGWPGRTMAAALLLFTAFAFPKDIEDGTKSNMNESKFAMVIADAWHLTMQIWTKVARISDSACVKLAAASEAAMAMAFLANCIHGVLFTKVEDYADEPVLRWKLRVTSFVADLAGSSHSRRRTLIQAGSGSIVDWLLESIKHGESEHRVIQAEAARALSHFLSDDAICDEVLGRQNALSQLLLFAASIKPNSSTKSLKSQGVVPFAENDESTRGRSMLVTALMDIITSSCQAKNKGGMQRKLPGFADAKDISAALKVLQEESLCLDESCDENIGDDDREIGQSMSKVLVTVQEQSTLHSLLGPVWNLLNTWRGNALSSGKGWQAKLTTHILAPGGANSKESLKTNQETVSHGLWDDLHSSHVLVPLAAWAIATWAQASSVNCAKIAMLDKDGSAILACLLAPEHTIKWHGAIAAHYVLENGFNEPAVSWSRALLETAQQAAKDQDAQLSLIALDAFYACVKKSTEAQDILTKNDIVLLTEIAKQSQDVGLQRVIDEILDILCSKAAEIVS